jgi:hypothetical protein
MFSTKTFPFGRKLAQDKHWVLAESTPDSSGKTSLGVYWYPQSQGKLGFPSAFNRPAWFNLPDPIAAAIRIVLPVLVESFPPEEIEVSARG